MIMQRVTAGIEQQIDYIRDDPVNYVFGLFFCDYTIIIINLKDLIDIKTQRIYPIRSSISRGNNTES